MRALVAAALGCALAGCGDEETRRPSLVDNPRILAIAADPAAPAPGDEVELRALVVDASGPRPDVAVQWRVCAPGRFILDPGVDCDAESSVALPGGRLVVPDVPPGLWVTVVAQAETAGAELIAVKEITVAGELPADNPALGELRLGGEVTERAMAGRLYDLSVAVAAAPLARADEDQDVIGALTFYGIAGEFDEPAVELVLDNAQVAASSVPWRAPDEPGPTFLWIVATTELGGTSWLEAELTVAP